FIQRMQPQVKPELLEAGSPEEAVRQSQIITTMTSSREPVLKGEWLQPGAHVNAAGGNLLLRREVDDETVMKSNRLVVDSIEQSKIEAGGVLGGIEKSPRT